MSLGLRNNRGRELERSGLVREWRVRLRSLEVFMVGMMNSKAGMMEMQMDLRGEPRHEEKKLMHC